MHRKMLLFERWLTQQVASDATIAEDYKCPISFIQLKAPNVYGFQNSMKMKNGAIRFPAMK